MHPITIIGVGDDGLASLAEKGRAALDAASMIVGGARHLAMLPDDDSRPRLSWSKDIAAMIDTMAAHRADHRICVLATGDPMHHGIGVQLVARFGINDLVILPAPSAFSLAAARMGWSLSDPMVSCISLHALPFATIRRHAQPSVRLLVLSRDGSTPAAVGMALTEMGYGSSPLTVLEHMGGADERRTDYRADDIGNNTFGNLNTIAVQCVADAGMAALSLAPGLADDAFDHDGTITKRDVRAVTLAALAPKPGELLWDVGAGSGTIAIEWLRAEPRAHAVAFERDPARAERAGANAARLGVPALRIVEGIFPDCAQGIDGPDAVFVGGGIAGDGAVIDAALAALKSGARLVANAVTLNAQSRLIAAHMANGGDLVRIGIAQAAAVGSHQALKPAIDVLQWRVTKA